MNTPNETRVTICKLDAKRQIAFGAVYQPYVPDSQGDFMTPEEIERVAHNFLKKGAVEAIDTEHNLVRNGSVVVESFISREGDPDFPVPGSWVLGVHIPDKAHWAKAESGEIGGFSMYGTGRRVQRVVEIEVPDDGVLFGKTEASMGQGAHEHVYALDFNDKGGFLGGETDEVNGHTHLIKKGTVTEPGPDGHRHRFNFVDTLAKGCGPLSEEQKGWQKKRKALRKHADHDQKDHGNWADGTDQVGRTLNDHIRSGNAWSGIHDAFHDTSRKELEAREGKPLPARRGRKDYVNLEGRQRTHSDFASGKAYVFQHGDGEQVFFLPQVKLKNGNWKGRKLNEGAGGRSRGKSVQDIFEPPGRSILRWYELADDETPVHLRKDDMTAEDMPEPVAEQKEVRCKKCQTPKACGKAGRCLISYEADEDEDDEESED